MASRQQKIAVYNRPLRKMKRVYSLLRSEYVFVSYPKCGRTWLRMLLGKYLSDLSNIEVPLRKLDIIESIHGKGIPRMSMHHLGYPQYRHYQKVKTGWVKLLNNKIIFLYRDPRPTSISFYYQFFDRGSSRKASPSSFYPEDLSEFVLGEYGGIKSIVAYMNAWAAHINNPNVLFLKYEALKEDSEIELKRILDFLEVSYKENVAKEAIDFCSFSNMKKLEEQSLLNPDRFGGSGNSAKVRQGGKKLWSEQFNQDTLKEIQTLMEELNPFYKYS